MWIVDSGSWNVRLKTKAGLLVDWRRHPLRDAWQGFVVTADGGGDQPWSLTMKWVDAERLVPVRETPPEMSEPARPSR